MKIDLFKIIFNTIIKMSFNSSSNSKATDSKFSELFFFGLIKSCLINGLDSNAVLLMPDFLMGTSLRIFSSQP